MDTQDNEVKAGPVRLVTSPARNPSWKDDPPRPYEVGWVKDQASLAQAQEELEKLFPLPSCSNIYDLGEITKIKTVFVLRDRYQRQKLQR
jgi:hypothetical protein